jgi:tetratricopeptide (TPR) repeat protein
LLAKRRTVHDRLLRALEDGLRSEASEPAIRAKMAEAVLNLDATHEEACRYLIREKATAGDVGGAMRLYKTLWDVLEADYDAEPSAPTQQLIVELRTRVPEPPPPKPPLERALGRERPVDPMEPLREEPPRSSERRSARRARRIELAVGGAALNGVQEDKAHLVQGFRQHLIACLVRFREWYVTDMASQSVAPGAGALTIGARYAIDMTAYQSGAVLNLVLTLREIDSSLYVWSDRFELKVEIWFEMQQRIVRRLAMALNVHLSTERLMRLAGEPDIALDIYDRWLRGQAMLAPVSSLNRRRAAEIFSEIIREAPDFSPAYSSLAQINNADHIAFPGTFRSREKEQQTLELARTAVRLDPMDSRAHLCLAWAQIMAKRYDEAELPIRLACELNENDPWTLTSAAMVLAFCADFERASKLAAQALELAPSPSPIHWGYQAVLRFLAGDYEACVRAGPRAGETLNILPAWLAAAQSHLGNRDKAIDEAQRFLARIRTDWYGDTAPTNAAVMKWLLHLYPIRRREDWERLRDGLAGAGVPVDGTDHDAW